MKSKLEQATSDVPGTSYEWRQKTVIQGYKTDIDLPVFQPLKHAFQELELPLIPIRTKGGSDVNIFAQKGIPSIVLSGAYYKPHQLDEYVQLQDMVVLTRMVLEIMKQYATYEH